MIFLQNLRSTKLGYPFQFPVHVMYVFLQVAFLKQACPNVDPMVLQDTLKYSIFAHLLPFMIT